MSAPDNLFPGFKVPPNDPSREVATRLPLTVCLSERELQREDDDRWMDDEDCDWCEGWGYRDCLCGGDFCVCTYNGEIPCPHCG